MVEINEKDLAFSTVLVSKDVPYGKAYVTAVLNPCITLNVLFEVSIRTVDETLIVAKCLSAKDAVRFFNQIKEDDL